ncbi:protein lev-9-like [Argopecten irradians]|uniref:protein lev-9-like n=1 Tax=Argopecten irradians TaxID=31199 RepID=UPI00371704AC
MVHRYLFHYTDCPELPPIIHASLTSDSRKVGVTVTYTCDAGYAGIGDDQRKCVGNGQWKGSTFECRDCGPPPDIPFGTVQPGDNLVGTDRFYLCGVLSTPDANAFITCQTDGQWSTATFTCVCPDPPSVPNASPSSSDKVVGTVITFTCDTGYVATGTSSITCLSTGAWESLTFTCTDCGDPPTVSGTSVQSGSNLVGSDRFYLCDTHANVLSNNYRTCQDTGEWSTTPISCGTWPNAVFSLLQPTTGCPTGFLSGSRTWHTEEFGSSSRSENFLAGRV